MARASCAECHCDAGEGSAHARIYRASGPRRLLRRLCPTHANQERCCARSGVIASDPLTRQSVMEELCFDRRNIFAFPNFLACVGPAGSGDHAGEGASYLRGWVAFPRAGAGEARHHLNAAQAHVYLYGATSARWREEPPPLPPASRPIAYMSIRRLAPRDLIPRSDRDLETFAPCLLAGINCSLPAGKLVPVLQTGSSRLTHGQLASMGDANEAARFLEDLRPFTRPGFLLLELMPRWGMRRLTTGQV